MEFKTLSELRALESILRHAAIGAYEEMVSGVKFDVPAQIIRGLEEEKDCYEYMLTTVAAKIRRLEINPAKVANALVRFSENDIRYLILRALSDAKYALGDSLASENQFQIDEYGALADYIEANGCHIPSPKL